MAFLSYDLPHREEEVDMGIEHRIGLVEPDNGLGGIIPVVADNLPDTLAVLLLNVSILIFAIGAAPGEL